MVHTPEEKRFRTGVMSPDSIRVVGPAGIVILMEACAFFLFAANGNTPDELDDDDVGENLKMLFDPPFNHGL